MKKIPVMVVEDNWLLRESIKDMIEQEKDFKLLATYEHIEEIQPGLSGALSAAPVILLELGNCNEKGLEAVKTVKAVVPESKIVIMNLLPKQEDILQLVSCGVEGFILKDAASEEFLTTVKTVFEGEKVLPQRLTNMLFSQIIEHNNSSEMSSFWESANLSSRERQIIRLVADGLTNKEIAQQLNLSSYTIKSHVHNILKKLDLRKRMQIARIAALQEIK
ncbi:MAG: response regulator transcription factor [Ignavibacteria bacterium]|nr:response regulator transcription factor [Ignavibacteria bacterium]MCU7504934.1 response regulator transcription factor [Ignavibacteria bacterium]MCU7518407.1 response regulator transcription factor [Ignavibacteria bacterium]